ncbi:glycosyltransferase family 2 protein [Chromohalobacter israelensis]|uniref:glycosyltransferase family 2 protein n=1 Tax=Chromohalobacter israelensis TaxID=141390 RepID=UPI0015C474BA|nr:glycosyltransferase family 2 protein [Chromohalobacter salexigens]NWO57317.1 glycosyltransferase family 2 protein [Chromohalobacter salexigens]
MNKRSGLVTIVLAAHNGEKYLKEQLESIRMQSFGAYRFLVCDDASSDSSFEILKDFLVSSGKSYELIKNEKRVGGKNNFKNLLATVDDDYIMFCDQDDFWLPKKIEVEMEEMKRLELLYPGKPIVVHSDLEVVDADLCTLAYSFFDSQHLPRKHETLLDQLVLNNVTGCTMLINRAARDLVLPMPDEAIMHDWWIAAKVRCQGGVVSVIDKPLVKYRQHGSNVIGAKKLGCVGVFQQLMSPWRILKGWKSIYRQAKAVTPSVTLLDIVRRKVILTLRRLRGTAY